MNISWVRESDRTVLDNSTNSRVTVDEELVTEQGLAIIWSTLEITSVEDMDESHYTCIAVNEFGIDSVVFELILDSNSKGEL